MLASAERWIQIVMAKILVVDDDETLLSMVTTALKNEHSVESTESGVQAAELLRFYTYDVVILDWNLPDRDGIDVLCEYRDRGGSIAVLLLTGKQDTDDKEKGLDCGADDYLTKPFEMRELKARLNALLRRSPVKKRATEYGDLSLDLEKLVLTIGQRQVQLLRREVQVLDLIIRARGEYLTTATLLEEVWGAANSSPGGLISCIKRLRDKVDLPGRESFIETTPRLGYRLNYHGRE